MRVPTFFCSRETFLEKTSLCLKVRLKKHIVNDKDA